MNQRTISSRVLSGGGLVLVCACSGPPEPSESPGSGGGGGVGGSAAAATGPVVVMPDASGWVDRQATWNTLGIQGAWYPYGDRYGKAKCTEVGMHQPSECSSISEPDPLVTGFLNQGGVMCTRGEVAPIIPCRPDVPLCSVGTPDYSNVWGAGIGLDLNALGAEQGGVKSAWDPDASGVTGVRFTINELPAAGLRVEFPIELPNGTTTEDHADGSPYWGATPDYPDSDVEIGVNSFRFTDVRAPKSSYAFDRKKIVAIQFHVPAAPLNSARSAYEFCISDLTFLRD